MRTLRRLGPGSAIASALILVIALLPSSVHAARGLASLGKLTSDSERISPVGSFVHIGVRLASNHRPEVLFLGSTDSTSAALTWPLVKALDQFGEWQGLRPTTDQPPKGLPAGAPIPATHPTYDLSHARYRSRYVTFVHMAPSARDLRLFGRLSRRVRSQFLRNGNGNAPLLTVAGYALWNPDVFSGDFEDTAGHGLSFSAAQTAIRRDEGGVHYALVHDVNAEANVIVALICHVTDRQPAHACDGRTIRGIARHIR